MTEEIKEILYMLKSVIDNPKETFCANATTCYLLLNYITNLQKEKEDYKQRNEKAAEYFKNLLKEEVVITDEDNINYGEKVQRAYFSDSELGKGINILQGGDE